jgi:hypothetical protein
MHMLPRHYEIIENADTVQTYSDHLRKIYVGLRTTSLGLLRASRTTGSFVEREVLAMMIESRDMKSSSPETLRRDLLCGGLVGNSSCIRRVFVGERTCWFRCLRCGLYGAAAGVGAGIGDGFGSGLGAGAVFSSVALLK